MSSKFFSFNSTYLEIQQCKTQLRNATTLAKYQCDLHSAYQSLCKSSLLFVLSCLAVHGAPVKCSNNVLLLKLQADRAAVQVREDKDISVLPDFTVVSPQFSGRSKNSSSPLLLMVVCRARHGATELLGLRHDRAARGDFSLLGDT